MKLRSVLLLLVGCALAVLTTAPVTAEPGISCLSDAQCASGFVCEPTDTGCSLASRQCVSGCRVGGRSCGNGQSCVARACVTCPCPGSCEWVPIGPPDPDGTESVIQIDGSNADNPYDAIGRLHNAGLDDAIRARATVGDDPLVLGVAMLQRVREFGCASGGEEPCTLRLPGIRVASLLNDPVKFKAEVADSLSDAQRPFFLRLFAVLDDPALGAVERVDEIRRLESDLMQALSEDEARTLLEATSVGRYSVVYWSSESARQWNLAPDLLDDAAFAEMAHRIPELDVLGGFCYGSTYVGALMGSVYALCWWILSLFT